MIESDNKRSFNSRASVITCSSFYCVVSTAKEGLFSGLSTMIAATYHPQIPLTGCGKVVYASSLGSDERHRVHTYIISKIDELGESGQSLYDILNSIFQELKSSGMATETVNALAKPEKPGPIYTDPQTGLNWATNGDIFGIEMNWFDAVERVKNLDYAGFNDWRLPTVDEFFAFVERGGKTNPSKWFNLNGFNNVLCDRYWTSTTYASRTDCACLMSTTGCKGKDEIEKKETGMYRVWPVRDTL